MLRGQERLRHICRALKSAAFSGSRSFMRPVIFACSGAREGSAAFVGPRSLTKPTIFACSRAREGSAVFLDHRSSEDETEFMNGNNLPLATPGVEHVYISFNGPDKNSDKVHTGPCGTNLKSSILLVHSWHVSRGPLQCKIPGPDKCRGFFPGPRARRG